MSQALRLAGEGLYTTHPNPRVGCVLVTAEAGVIAEGWHRQTGGPHAEITALTAAGDRARGADCYVTLEPCSHAGRTPPCADALIRAGVRRVIIATGDPNPQVSGKGIERLQGAGITTECGLMQVEARALNPGFEMRMRQGRPWVRSKLAVSLDGKTALADGASKWITGDAARKDVQRLRAQSSAILTGIGTVLSDDPALTVRDVDTGGRQPLRVVIDPELRMPQKSRMLSEPGKTLVFTLAGNEAKKPALPGEGNTVIPLSVADRESMIHPVLEYLARDEEINEVLVEAGSALNGALLQAGVIDELVIYMASHILGHDARGMFNIPVIREMNQRVAFSFKDVRMVGTDCRIILKPVTSNQVNSD
jgi:riboflavin biosynthesis protein RibD